MEWVIGVITGVVSSLLVSGFFLIRDKVIDNKSSTFIKDETYFSLIFKVSHIMEFHNYKNLNGYIALEQVLDELINDPIDIKVENLLWFKDIDLDQMVEKFFILYVNNKIKSDEYNGIKWLAFHYKKALSDTDKIHIDEFYLELKKLALSDKKIKTLQFCVKSKRIVVKPKAYVSKKTKKIIEIIEDL